MLKLSLPIAVTFAGKNQANDPETSFSGSLRPSR